MKTSRLMMIFGSLCLIDGVLMLSVNDYMGIIYLVVGLFFTLPVYISRVVIEERLNENQ